MKWVSLKRATDDAVRAALQVSPHAEGLLLESSKLTDLACLSDATALLELVIDHAPRLESLVGIEQVAPTLRRLVIKHAPRIKELDALRALKNLEELSLSIAMSGTSNQRVASFKPLGRLLNLRSLRFVGVTTADGDLSPLYALQRLEEVGIPNFYDVEQVGRLSGALPNARGFGLSPVVEYRDRKQGCGACGGTTEVQLIGRRRGRFVCAECDAGVIARHIKTFEHFRDLRRD